MWLDGIVCWKELEFPLFEDHPLNQLVLNGSRGKNHGKEMEAPERQILVPLTKYFIITRVRGDVNSSCMGSAGRKLDMEL